MMTGDMKGLKQHPGGTGYMLDRGIERNLVRSRGRIESADLPNELKRSVMQLLVGRVMSGVPQSLDVSAHVVSSLSAMIRLQRRAESPGRSHVLSCRGHFAE